LIGLQPGAICFSWLVGFAFGQSFLFAVREKLRTSHYWVVHAKGTTYDLPALAVKLQKWIPKITYQMEMFTTKKEG
jgi:hypothetical protein